LSGRGLCDELITRAEESYRLCCVVVCDLETSRMGAPYIYDISHLRVKLLFTNSARIFFHIKKVAVNTLNKQMQIADKKNVNSSGSGITVHNDKYTSKLLNILWGFISCHKNGY